MPSNLRIDPDRLWSTLMETAAIGGTAKGGINRQTLTEHDRVVRAWFKRETEALGCTVTVDEVGNMFALRPGRHKELAPIALGSHLDTQPTGGKFDGNLGVLGALEALRTLVAAGYETNAGIVVVNWTNEEGARFAPAMLGSGVFAGVYSRAEADAVADIEGVRFGEALDRIGWRGAAKAGGMPLSAYLELHIEQGPILEAEDKTIGVVTGVQGVRWYEATITGRESHAGTTPMHLRRDSLAAAAEWIVAVEHTAQKDPDLVATVGRIDAKPGATNVIAGEVCATLDVRHKSDDVRQRTTDALVENALHIADRRGLSLVSRVLLDQCAVAMDSYLLTEIDQAIRMTGSHPHRVVSGAGHDAMILAEKVPAGMIFLRTPGGISHDPAESVDVADVAKAIECGLCLLDQLAHSSRLQERMSRA